MNIAIVTNIRSPYRKLQLEEFTKTQGYNFNVYFTDKDVVGRKWKVDEIRGVQEHYLNGIKISNRYGNLNFGLVKLVLSNDVIVIGGYEQPTYIMISVLCRIFNKPYIIIYDGINPKRIYTKESKIKYLLKKFVISKATSIFGNGQVSKEYFSKQFKYNVDSIYNQYLTVDIDRIIAIGDRKEIIRQQLREKYNIPQSSRTIMYSGRLIKRKNVDKIIEAINSLSDKEEYTLLIVGDGEEKESLKTLIEKVNVNVVFTDFIEEQDKLFEYYFMADTLILPSEDEPWGLVINEAMAAGLPVIASDECGAYMDLVSNDKNGYVVSAGSVQDIANSLNNIFYSKEKKCELGTNSLEMISKWKFVDSRKSFEKMITTIFKYKEGSL